MQLGKLSSECVDQAVSEVKGREPETGFLRRFGCLAFIWTRATDEGRQTRGKLRRRGAPAVLLGFSEFSSSWKFGRWVPAKGGWLWQDSVESRHAVFLESVPVTDINLLRAGRKGVLKLCQDAGVSLPSLDLLPGDKQRPAAGNQTNAPLSFETPPAEEKEATLEKVEGEGSQPPKLPKQRRAAECGGYYLSLIHI